jgi:phage terminase small subunit
MALTDKQRLFVKEYLVDLNATQAAIRAGYSEKTAYSIGHENLNKPDISHAIKEAMLEREQKAEVDAEYVIQNLKKVVSRSLQETPVMKWDYEERKLTETGEFTYDSTGANRALELLGKHLGMFTDKVKMDVNGEVKNTHEYHIEQTITTDQESAELLKQLYKRQSAIDTPVGNSS